MKNHFVGAGSQDGCPSFLDYGARINESAFPSQNYTEICCLDCTINGKIIWYFYGLLNAYHCVIVNISYLLKNDVL